MAKRRADVPPTSVQRPRKRTKSTTTTFVWKPRDWVKRISITDVVSILVNKTNTKQLIVRKVLQVTPDAGGTMRPREIRALSLLPDCNRIVKPLLYTPSNPYDGYGCAIFELYPQGDLVQWKTSNFDKKRFKPVAESHIWRFFVQIGQAVAFLQNHLGPWSDEREVMIHRDIKPRNILVVDNRTTYPSFKLHDFGTATTYQKEKAGRASHCGTYEWQPPENPIINTKAADIWSLGACIHWLATGQAPIQSVTHYTTVRFNELHRHPTSVSEYGSPARYYAARVPRKITPINISEEEQSNAGIAPNISGDGPSFSHQYSDELNDWMTLCLGHTPSRRPTAKSLMTAMVAEARNILRDSGGQAALSDLDIEFD